MITPSYGLTATERVLPKLTLDWTTGLAQTNVDVTRAGVATFIGSNGLVQSATADTQRIDYSTGTPGLLVEESRTNLCFYSEDFGTGWIVNTGGTGVGATITTDAGTAPDGNTTADLIVFDTGGGTTSNDYVQVDSNQIACTISTDYTLSFWAKTSDGSSKTYTIVHPRGASEIVIFGANWQRYTFTATAATGGTGRIRFRARGDRTETQVSSIYLWGVQFEEGAFPTSYIPTTSAAVTRNADVAAMTGTDFTDWFNSAEGTFFIETNARNGDDLLTAGSYVLTADATALKKYATTYTADPSATQLDFGKGTIQRMMYYPHDLIAAELAALTA